MKEEEVDLEAIVKIEREEVIGKEKEIERRKDTPLTPTHPPVEVEAIAEEGIKV